MSNPFQITMLYVAINAAVLLTLALLASRARALAAPGGDAGNVQLAAALRASADAAQWMPLGLLMLLIVVSISGPAPFVHVIGVPLTLGRILAAAGLSRGTTGAWLRLAGTVLTWIGFALALLICLWFALAPLSAPAS